MAYLRKKTIGSITYVAEFQLQPFAWFAKPARSPNLEPLNKLIILNLKTRESTTRPISVAVKQGQI